MLYSGLYDDLLYSISKSVITLYILDQVVQGLKKKKGGVKGGVRGGFKWGTYISHPPSLPCFIFITIFSLLWNV